MYTKGFKLVLNTGGIRHEVQGKKQSLHHMIPTRDLNIATLSTKMATDYFFFLMPFLNIVHKFGFININVFCRTQ